MGPTSGQASLLSALAVGEFRAMWSAEALSQAGDQLARVALSVLVFERTSSAGLTALAYGLTYLPTVLGGTLLSGLADRYPRRAVMVACDLFRMLMAAGMAIPGTPLTVLCGLLVALTIAGGPARAAQLAMLPAVLVGEEPYLRGLAIRNITIQSAQVVGFAFGGIAIALVGPYWGLAVDALTFLVSALLVYFGVRPRPAASAPSRRARRAGWSQGSWFGGGLAAVWAVRGGRVLFGLKMLAGFYVLPEGLAAPYAAQLGAGTFVVGLILAADPVGSVVGAWIYARWVPAIWKPPLTGWLAVGSGIPLAFLLLRPGVPASLVLIALSGALSTPYQMQATAIVTRAVPDDVRGQVSGLTSTALVTVQGVGIVLGGALAQLIGVSTTLGCAAIVGAVLGVAGAVAWMRATTRRPQPGVTG